MHSRLEQQLRKHLDPSAPIPPAWWAILDEVSLVYQEADTLRADRNLPVDVARKQLTERNQQLEATNAALSAASQWLRSTLECTADGILVVDLNGNVISWNAKFLEMWRIPADLVKERNDEKLLKFVLSQLKDPAAFIAKIQELYRDQITSSLDVLEFTDGRVFERYSQPHRNGNDCGGRVWSFRDITALRQAADSLAQARDAAEAANHAKSRFLANMSHEIRTPMTAILGFADLLRDAHATSANRDVWIETIRRNGNHLLALINDILDVSIIEAGQMTIERLTFQFQPAIDDLIQTMQERAAAKGLTLTVHRQNGVPDVLYSDPTRFRQILLNLLSNAIKFTEAGGIEVVFKMTREKLLCIDVIDTGIGLAPHQRARLFQPFTQGDTSTTRKFGGTGLGLAITKRLAQMLGGDVQVSSTEGKGSTFTVTVQATPPAGTQQESAEQQCAPAATDAPALAGLRILLAEDGEDNQELINLHLTFAGAQVTLVENGVQACTAALTALKTGQPFDLILMDMQMPEMDGYEATSHLRSHGYAAPIVALTAHVMSGDREKCLAAGCDDFLGKPIDPAMLVNTAARMARSSTTAPIEVRLSA
jgi:signal transduction histidine kinase/ActR/RegA family two-component response regulator